jgi:hypothetical protein
MNSYAKWFGRLVWLGILGNLLFGLAGLFAPDFLFSTFKLEPAVPTIWTRDAGLFLIMLSLFYIPAALNPYRYRVNAWLLVIGRLAFAVFWLWGVFFSDFPREYLPFGLTDLSLGIIQGIFLVLTFRAEKQGYLKELSPAEHLKLQS